MSKTENWLLLIEEVRKELAIDPPAGVDPESFNAGLSIGSRVVDTIENDISISKCMHCGDMLSPGFNDCGCKGQLYYKVVNLISEWTLMYSQKDYEQAFAELANLKPIPAEVRKQMEVDRTKAEFEDVVQRIGRYCYDFCKKAPAGEYPAIPEKCPYDHCPLYKYRMGKV